MNRFLSDRVSIFQGIEGRFPGLPKISGQLRQIAQQLPNPPALPPLPGNQNNQTTAVLPISYHYQEPEPNPPELQPEPFVIKGSGRFGSYSYGSTWGSSQNGAANRDVFTRRGVSG